MPIKPENKIRYPADWPQIRARMLLRAGNKCEWCGVANYARGYRKPGGEFVELTEAEADARYQSGLDFKRVDLVCIILTTAHVHDRSPENCADENLAILCQRCHLNHDRGANGQTRLATEKAKEVAAGQLMLLEKGERWPD
jgi:hypothetical protein